MRLFMVPGMGHCGGGAGVNTFDSIGNDREMGREGHRPGPDNGKEQRGNSDASAVPVSSVCGIQGNAAI